jgi:hypothetical protein
MRDQIPEIVRKTAWKLAEGVHRAAGCEPLWVPPGHFYSPIGNRRESAEHLERVERLAAEPELQGIVIDRELFRTNWQELLPFLAQPTLGTGTPRYSLDRKGQFSRSDALMLHAFMRRFRPRKVIEIGSGSSSACMLDTADLHLEGCEFTFIDPYPQRLLDQIRPEDHRHEIVRKRVQEVPLDRFRSLQANDILFIDSSHVAKTGSDVCHELFEILPRLAEGVLVHVHDIMWPFEYPRRWLIEENRSWNEAQFLRAFLSGNRSYRIEMFSDWMKRFERELVANTVPGFLEQPSGSIWLRKVTAD